MNEPRMDLQTRCIKCQSFRYFDINQHGIFEPAWICPQCLPQEYTKVKAENESLKAIILQTVENDAQCVTATATT
jgi:hypothetical protein